MTPDTTTVGAWLIGAAAVAAALLGLWKLITALWRLARRVGHFLDDWGGEPERPGHPARPGIPERMAGVEKSLGSMCDRLGLVETRTARIEHELHPNSGASLRDAMDRVERTVSQPTVQQTFISPPPDHE